MAGQEDPVQREIHQDWANREYIEVITSSIKKIADFLNSFGQRESRGRRGGGRALRLCGSGAESCEGLSGSPRLLLVVSPSALTLRPHWAACLGWLTSPSFSQPAPSTLCILSSFQ